MLETVDKAIKMAPKIVAITNEITAKHIQRDDVVKATLLALISGRPVFFLGSPGIDKTGTIQALVHRIGGATFYDALMPTIVSVEQLLVESTSIEEVPTASGGKSIRTHDLLGRAALAHLLFADEIWKAEPRVLQTLLDLSKGDGVRHEGQMVETPLLAFLAASNELPDSEGNLGAIWSRMTLRVQVQPLNRGGKKALVQARLNRDRNTRAVATTSITLADVETLRKARPHVTVSEEIIDIVLDIIQELVDDQTQDFKWAWYDDRRFGRIFDVLQANALLNGRSTVNKSDLVVLEWLLWDVPEQIATVKAKVAPYCRTALSEAQELMDTLMTPGGIVETVAKGDRIKGVQAIAQCEEAHKELMRLTNEAGDDAMKAEITKLVQQVEAAKADVIAVVTGAKK